MKGKRSLSRSANDCKYLLFGFRNTVKGSIWSLEKTYERNFKELASHR